MRRFIEKVKAFFRDDDPLSGSYAWEIPDDDMPNSPDGPSPTQVNAWTETVIAELDRRQALNRLISDAREQQYRRQTAYDLAELSTVFGIEFSDTPPAPS